MNKKLSIFFILLFFGFVSYSSFSPVISEASSNTRVRYRKGAFVDRYWFDSEAFLAFRDPTLAIGNINVSGITSKSGITLEMCRKNMQESLEEEARESIIAFIPGGNNASLELNINFIKMDPGSHASRVLAGELGFGRASVEVEGMVVDRITGNIIFSFKDREAGTGSWGMQNIGGDISDKLIARFIGKIANNVIRELNYRVRRAGV